MPFCCQCGNQVGAADIFCAKCGARQQAPAGQPPRPAPPPPPRASEPLSGISPRSASVLCYIPFIGWLMAIIILASDRFRRHRDVRFHAFQGLYLFVAWLVAESAGRWMFAWVPGPFHLEKLLKLALLAASIFMLVKTSQDRTYSLPILGDLAEKSLSES